MPDIHDRLVDALARQFGVEARRASSPRQPMSSNDDRVLAGTSGGFPFDITLHVRNPYELGHIGDERFCASSPAAVRASSIDPQATLQIKVRRETPYPIYFSARNEDEATRPAPAPPTLMKKLRRRFLGGFYDVPFGALSVQVSSERLIEPTRLQLVARYGTPMGTIEPRVDSMMHAFSGQPDLTRRRLLERELIDDCLDAVCGNAPDWSGIHFANGDLMYSTTVTDLTTPALVVKLLEFLPRLAHSLYDER